MTKPRTVYVASALALGLAWIPALILTGFAYDQPSVSGRVAVARELMAWSLELFPVFWIVSLVFLVVEIRSRKSQIGMTIAVLACHLAAVAHLTAWIVVL